MDGEDGEAPSRGKSAAQQVTLERLAPNDGVRHLYDVPSLPTVRCVHQCGAGQREKLHVIAPRARQTIGKAELAGKRIHHRDGLQQALRVAMQREDVLALAARQQATAAVNSLNGIAPCG